MAAGGRGIAGKSESGITYGASKTHSSKLEKSGLDHAWGKIVASMEA